MYYFIVNPNAGEGRGAACWRQIRRQLEKSGLSYEAMLTQKRGDARDFASSLAGRDSGSSIVVAVGGDGTINEVIDGLAFDDTITLGLIPIGIHNGFSKCIGLPRNLRACFKKVISPQNYRALDYGVLSYGGEIPRHRRFAIACGIGLGAAVYGRLEDSKNKFGNRRKILPKHSHGSSWYLMHGISELCQSNPVKGYIVLDGVKKIEFNRIFIITAHIYPQENKRFLRRRRQGDKGDGIMEINVIHGTSKLRLLPIFADTWRNRNTQRSGVRRYTCRDLFIHVDSPMPVHVDGEICERQTDIVLSCVKKKIRMIV